MRRLTLSARITAAFLALITMALVEAGIVLYVQRESSMALDEMLRTQLILLDEATIRASLRAMQGAVRGFVLRVDGDQLGLYNEQRARYERLLKETAGLIRDSTQAARFDRVVALATAWQQAAEQIVAETRVGRDPSTTMNVVALPRFAELEEELDAFVERQQTLSRTADAVARARIRNATIILTAIPAVAVVFMFGLLLASRRALRPLGSLVESAMRLARGDYGAPLPRTGEHEIGALVDAFDRMRAAVRDRESSAQQAQDLARAAHGELLGVLETAPAGIVVVDRDGIIRLQNRAADHLVGVSQADRVDARTAWSRLVVRDASGNPLKFADFPVVRALGGAEVIGEELDVLRPDGWRFHFLVSAAPLRDGSNRVMGAVVGFQDITRLRELDRLKDEFVAIVSHELRTPLTAIRGSLQLLLAEHAAPNPEHHELLTVASSSCERLVRIVNDMLDLSKIEAGRLPLRLGPQPVEPLVRQAAAAMDGLAGPAGVRVEARIPPDIPPVRADADRLTQALVNLLSNAIKYAPRGTAVTISARAIEQVVALSVADHGPGIAPEDLPRLFQKFQQLDSAGTRRTGGTGLGLVITKAIVEEHGGQISVDSAVGEGTTFTITVPVATTDEPASRPARAEAAALTTAGDGGTPTVLVVDDRPENRAPTVEAMRAAGFRTMEAASAPEALDLARRERIDAIALTLVDDRSAESAIEALGRDTATAGIPVVIPMSAAPVSHAAVVEHESAGLVARIQQALGGRLQGTILIAEDDADARTVLRKVLERQGFRVAEAADGAEALERATTLLPDLVLLDVRMPRVHGHDVIRTLRDNATTARLPILVLSGSVGERQSLYSLVLGANAFLAKPADPAALVREVARLVRREPEP